MMQEVLYSVNIPSLLVIGFLVGVVLLLLGYRETENVTKHHHFMGIGLIIIGIMIPITPLSWYLYWVGLMLDIIEIAVVLISVVIGLFVVYRGGKIYSTKIL